MTHTHVITGTFGSGKTTAIRHLMSTKPKSELWVVILNEFTGIGLDALSVAQSAIGSYDVRLVAGGCLCCVGELEFGKQLRDILRTLKPTRLLIEPSGAGHVANIVDELARYVNQKALTLDSIVCLVDAEDAVRIAARGAGSEWSQTQSADVLIMSKSDLAGAAQREAFAAIAAAQYPAKRFIGECTAGILPPQALQPYNRSAGFSLLRESEVEPPHAEEFSVLGRSGRETHSHQLGVWASGWTLPADLLFSRTLLEPRLTWMIDAYAGWLLRFKAVFRTGPGPAWMVQSHGRGLNQEDSAYRRDSRLEIVMNQAPTSQFLEEWRSLLRDAALPPLT